MNFIPGEDCEVFSILSTDVVEEQEAIECANCPPQEAVKPSEAVFELDANVEVLEDLDLDRRRSWKDEPQKGSCYDNDLGYLSDCKLDSILK